MHIIYKFIIYIFTPSPGPLKKKEKKCPISGNNSKVNLIKRMRKEYSAGMECSFSICRLLKKLVCIHL